MKKLLVLLFSMFALSLSVNAADVYYCADNARTGFDMQDNLKQTNFYPKKFKVMIDFDNEKISSKEIWYSSEYRQNCFSNAGALYCMNGVGTAFSINKLTLRYFFADLYNAKDTIQDPALSNGTCEKF